MTAEEVTALPVGSRVLLCGEDQNGQQQEAVCTIAGLPPQTFLTYRLNGEIRSCKIKDYPGKEYRLEKRKRAKK